MLESWSFAEGLKFGAAAAGAGGVCRPGNQVRLARTSCLNTRHRALRGGVIVPIGRHFFLLLRLHSGPRSSKSRPLIPLVLLGGILASSDVCMLVTKKATRSLASPPSASSHFHRNRPYTRSPCLSLYPFGICAMRAAAHCWECIRIRPQIPQKAVGGGPRRHQLDEVSLCVNFVYRNRGSF